VTDELLDVEPFIYQLLGRDIHAQSEDVIVSADIDITSLDELPVVSFILTSDPANDGPGLYHFTLDINVFGEGMDAAKALAQMVDGIVFGWNGNEQARVDDIGWVNAVGYIQRFTRLPSSVIDGRNTTQYSGTYALALRN